MESAGAAVAGGICAGGGEAGASKKTFASPNVCIFLTRGVSHPLFIFQLNLRPPPGIRLPRVVLEDARGAVRSEAIAARAGVVPEEASEDRRAPGRGDCGAERGCALAGQVHED